MIPNYPQLAPHIKGKINKNKNKNTLLTRYDNVTLSPLLLQRGLRFGPIQRNGAN